jgi:hypothetical protein
MSSTSIPFAGRHYVPPGCARAVGGAAAAPGGTPASPSAYAGPGGPGGAGADGDATRGLEAVPGR